AVPVPPALKTADPLLNSTALQDIEKGNSAALLAPRGNNESNAALQQAPELRERNLARVDTAKTEPLKPQLVSRRTKVGQKSSMDDEAKIAHRSTLQESAASERRTPAATTIAAISPGAPTPVEAQGTLERMQSAYRNGDLSAMMELFAHQPVGESRATL